MGREYPNHPLVGVGAVIKKGDRVLLVKRNNEPAKGLWSIPGGLVELGETVRDAVLREVKEETSLSIELGEIIDVMDQIIKDESGRIRFHYVLVDFLARPVDDEAVAKSECEEVSELRWVGADELSGLQLTNATRKLLHKIGFKTLREI